MKHLLFAIMFISPLSLFSQFTDDFSDGDFTANPSWTGDTGQFEVNDAGQLHLRSQNSDTSFLAVGNNSGPECEWTFWVKLSFNTSANNHCRVYLSADTPSLEGPVHGYYLQLGGSHDSMALFRQDGSELSEIFRLPSGVLSHSSNTLRFRIVRENSNWTVGVDTIGGTDYIEEGTFIEDTYAGSPFSGVVCRYTSSNAAKFYFDDFYCGPVIRDTVPPGVLSVTALNGQMVRVLFSEPPDKALAEDPVHYAIQGGDIHPVSAMTDPENMKRILLTLDGTIPGDSCETLMISGIADPAGNLSGDTSILFCRHDAAVFDVLINEIMADPSPAVSLPESEYIELFNRSAFPVDMQGWTLEYGTTEKEFPDVTILSGGYLIISEDTAFRAYGDMIPLFTAGYNLPNEGTTITLRDSMHRVIHSIPISSAWFDGSFKEDGGWSLELADPGNPCGCHENWFGSADVSGGTPGRINSVWGQVPDHSRPVVAGVFIEPPHVARLLFSEMMDSTGLSRRDSWEISNGTGIPDSILMSGPGYSSVGLYYDVKFDSGIIYTIICDTMQYDCAGNRILLETEIAAAIPESPASRDVLISEILAEPQPGGSRYFEVYNNSAYPIDLKDLLLRYTSGADSAEAIVKPAIQGNHVIFPGDYAALCDDDTDVKTRYYVPIPGHVIEMPSLPAFSREGGDLALLRSSDGLLIDRVRYDASMHHPLINSTAGVSLEKIDPGGSSLEPSNWHSASSGSGYGTPGYRNSQFRCGSDNRDEGIMLDPQAISPDNDGRDDVLRIKVSLQDQENVAGISIFNSRGLIVKQVAASSLAGPENVYQWDGVTTDRKKAEPGLYFIYVEIINSNGKARHMRKTFAVAFPG